jgi:hypothetical protein
MMCGRSGGKNVLVNQSAKAIATLNIPNQCSSHGSQYMPLRNGTAF